MKAAEDDSSFVAVRHCLHCRKLACSQPVNWRQGTTRVILMLKLAQFGVHADRQAASAIGRSAVPTLAMAHNGSANAEI